eukprot:s8678_g1.t1
MLLLRFVSHAWLEPVCKFVACLKRHASLRQLSDQTAYWVCAYANNQHQLQNDICNNPRKTSFYRAIQLCAGVLLVLDQNATPFKRTFAWKLASKEWQWGLESATSKSLEIGCGYRIGH